jgi:hypothetical protein
MNRPVVFCALLLCLLAPPASAHMPMESTMTVRFEHGRLEVILIMSANMAGAYLGEAEPVFVDSKTIVALRPRLLERASKLVELAVGGVPLRMEMCNAGAGKGNEVEFLLAYPRPDSGPLDIRTSYLSLLGENFTGSLVVLDGNETQIASKLVTRNDTALQVALDPSLLANPPKPTAGASPAQSQPNRPRDKPGFLGKNEIRILFALAVAGGFLSLTRRFFFKPREP